MTGVAAAPWTTTESSTVKATTDQSPPEDPVQERFVVVAALVCLAVAQVVAVGDLEQGP